MDLGLIGELVEGGTTLKNYNNFQILNFRFYLGHWQEGIGKLFSFGGLGVWVLVDSILISVGFLGTSDGSRLI